MEGWSEDDLASGDKDRAPILTFCSLFWLGKRSRLKWALTSECLPSRNASEVSVPAAQASQFKGYTVPPSVLDFKGLLPSHLHPSLLAKPQLILHSGELVRQADLMWERTFKKTSSTVGSWLLKQKKREVLEKQNSFWGFVLSFHPIQPLTILSQIKHRYSTNVVWVFCLYLSFVYLKTIL